MIKYSKVGEVMTLKEIRKEKKLSIEAVGRQIGVSHVTVINWESGKSEPGASAVVALAGVYGVSAEEILKAIPKKRVRG